MASTIEEFIDHTAAATRRSELFSLFKRFLENKAVEVASYHQVRHRFERTEFGESLKFFSFPERWVEHYEKSDYYEIDPIIAASRNTAEPFRWFDVGDHIPLTKEQQEYLEDLRNSGVTDGLAVPVFGPAGDMAYFGLGTTNGDLVLSEAEIDEIHLACHQFHLRFSEISAAQEDDEEVPISLSPRESEILSWVAKGKSNSIIGEILGISEHTVDTNLRRAFSKLGVNSRITAAVKAVGSGLIDV